MNHQLTTQELKSDYKYALSLYQSGDYQGVETICRRILLNHPNHADSLHLLGVIAYRLKHYEQAVSLINQAVRFNPGNAGYYNNLGNVLNDQGKWEESLDSYQQALNQDAGYAEAWCNMGSPLTRLNRFEEALAAYQQAIKLKPDYISAYHCLGNLYGTLGKFQEAEYWLKKSLDVNPGSHESYYLLAGLYISRQQLTKGINFCQSCLKINPHYHPAWILLGNASYLTGNMEQAAHSYRKAIALNPGSGDAYNNLGNILNEYGDSRGAMECYAKALAINPRNSRWHSNLLMSLHYRPVKDPIELKSAHDQWRQTHADPLISAIKPHNNDITEHRRLRVGFLSADFGRHPVGYFFKPYLKYRHRDQTEIFIYSHRQREDDFSEYMQSLCDVWRRTYHLSDEELAETVRQDKIDILVDVSGHTGNNRLLVLARKPAPVQVTWLAYPDTTGLTTIDYLITDRRVSPAGYDRFFSETLIRFPDCYLCYDPPENPPSIEPLPRFTNGYITFGCFNNVAKITPETVSLWAEILHQAPQAKLTLKHKSLNDAEIRRIYQTMFIEQQIAENRIELLGTSPSHHEHLATYNKIDIALDPYPYNGTTTTCDALFMGVPVISLAGNMFVARQGVTLLSNVGLNNWIADNSAQYIKKALEFAANPELIQLIRRQLRPAMLTSPLTNADWFSRKMEAAMRKIWAIYCAKNKRIVQ